MYKSQKGFTLIELVVVIVLLGILGVTALGKFQDLSGAARAAAVDGIASEISAAAAINYAASAVQTEDVEIGPAAPGTGIVAGSTAVAACTVANVAKLLGSGAFPNGYTIGGSAAANSGNCAAANLGVGGTFQCTITDSTSSDAADATLICTADS